MPKSNLLLRSSNTSSREKVCPASGIHYSGDCPLATCPANLACLSSGMRQGCYFAHAKNPDMASIAHVLGMTEGEAQEQYESGMSAMQHINMLMDIASTEAPFCKYCGFPAEEECFDEDRCDIHTRLIDLCMEKPPYNVRDFGFTKEGMWRVAVTKPYAGSIPVKMRDYVKMVRQDEGYTPPVALRRFMTPSRKK